MRSFRCRLKKIGCLSPTIWINSETDFFGNNHLHFSSPRTSSMFCFHTKLICHLRAEVLDWSESKTSIYQRFIRVAKTEVLISTKNWDQTRLSR